MSVDFREFSFTLIYRFRHIYIYIDNYTNIKCKEVVKIEFV